MDSFKVYIHNKKIIDGMNLSLDTAKIEPSIKFNRNPNKYYTIIMVDPDAPSRNNAYLKYWLHLLIINNNFAVKEYEPPSPPKGSGKHRYFIYLYEQQEKLDPNDLKYIGARNNFNLVDFVERFKLKNIDSVYFETENV